MQEHQFTLIPGWLYQLNLKPNERELFGLVNGLSQQHGYCYASNDYIAERLNLSERSVRRIIDKLEDIGLILVRKTKKPWAGFERALIPSTEYPEFLVSMKDEDPSDEALEAVENYAQGDMICPDSVTNCPGGVTNCPEGVTNCQNALYIDRVSNNKVDKYTPPLSDTDSSTPKKKPAKLQFGENLHVHLTEDEIQKLTKQLGLKKLTDCVNKLDAWIASDPTPKRLRNGKNAAACFRSWVIKAVEEQQARLDRASGKQKTQYERNLEILAEASNEEGWQ